MELLPDSDKKKPRIIYEEVRDFPGWNRAPYLSFYDQNMNLRARVIEMFTTNGYYTYFHWCAILGDQETDDGDELTEEGAIEAAEAAMAKQCFQMTLF